MFLNISMYGGTNLNRYNFNNTIPKETESAKINKSTLGTENRISLQNKVNNGECKTCKERKYQDGSDDPSVSFKTPTNISPENSASAVMSHEMEHVANENGKADREGMKVVSQSVTLQTCVCAECGKAYVAGGETKTVTASKTGKDYFLDNHNKFMQGQFGGSIDMKI